MTCECGSTTGTQSSVGFDSGGIVQPLDPGSSLSEMSLGSAVLATPVAGAPIKCPGKEFESGMKTFTADSTTATNPSGWFEDKNAALKAARLKVLEALNAHWKKKGYKCEKICMNPRGKGLKCPDPYFAVFEQTQGLVCSTRITARNGKIMYSAICRIGSGGKWTYPVVVTCTCEEPK